MDNLLLKKKWTDVVEPKDRKAPPKIKQESDDVCSCIGQCSCQASKRKAADGPDQFLNTPDDVQWLEDVHLIGDLSKHKGTFKSFTMKGNEDWPNEIVLFQDADPSVDDKPVATITADEISKSKDKKESNVKCPECGKPIWDVATVDQALNKCWECGTRWMNDTGDGEEREAAQFGSVEWQAEMEKRVQDKLLKGEPLDDSEQAFVETQGEHNKRMIDKQVQTSSVRAFHKLATGEADQDYDHALYDEITNALIAEGFRASHREFDKYQGVYIKVDGDNVHEKFWTEDALASGEREDAGTKYKYLDAWLLDPRGEKVSVSKGDYFQYPPEHVLKGYRLYFVRDDSFGGGEEFMDDPKVSDLPETIGAGAEVKPETFTYKPGTEKWHYIFYPESDPDTKIEYAGGSQDVSEFVAFLESKRPQKKSSLTRVADARVSAAMELVNYVYRKMAADPEHFANFVLGGMNYDDFISEAEIMERELKEGARWIPDDPQYDALVKKFAEVGTGEGLETISSKDWEPCTNCGGDGHVEGKECPACEGTGRLPKDVEASWTKTAAHGDKRDYPKIEIFVDKEYKATTTWAKTCQEAKEKYLEQHKDLKPEQVQCSRKKEAGVVKRMVTAIEEMGIDDADAHGVGDPEWTDKVLQESQDYYAKAHMVPDQDDLIGYIRDMAGNEAGIEVTMDMAAEYYQEWVTWRDSKQASLKQKADFADEHGIADDAPAVEDLLQTDEPTKPAEDDIVIVTEGQLGGMYAAYQGGKQIAKSVEWDEIMQAIKSHMDKEQFYPGIWFQDDHGGVTPVEDTTKIAQLAEGMGDEEFDADQLAVGAKHEMEHTKDANVAKQIAKDHLVEDPNYYRKLETIHAAEASDWESVKRGEFDDEMEAETFMTKHYLENGFYRKEGDKYVVYEESPVGGAKSLSPRIMEELEELKDSLYRANAPGTNAYRFSVDGNKIYRGEYVHESDGFGPFQYLYVYDSKELKQNQDYKPTSFASLTKAAGEWTITGNELHQKQIANQPVEIGGQKYSVHKMNYGDYFLEPVGAHATERDFAAGTVWLKKIGNTKPDFAGRVDSIYTVEASMKKTADEFAPPDAVRMMAESCQCSDPGCPAHLEKSICGNQATVTLHRIDMEDVTGTEMCADCAEDAMESGAFTIKEMGVEGSFDEWECPKCGDVLETPLEIRIHDKMCDGKVERVRVGSTEGGKCARCGTASGGKDMCETCKKQLKELMNIEAGLSDQVKSLRRKLKDLDVDKADPSEIASTVDALEKMEKRLKDQQDARQTKKDERAKEAEEAQKVTAGLSDQVKTLRKKLKDLDVDKADSSEIASTVDALEKLEKRLKEQQDGRAKRKEERAQEAKTEVTAAEQADEYWCRDCQMPFFPNRASEHEGHDIVATRKAADATGFVVSVDYAGDEPQKFSVGGEHYYVDEGFLILDEIPAWRLGQVLAALHDDDGVGDNITVTDMYTGKIVADDWNAAQELAAQSATETQATVQAAIKEFFSMKRESKLPKKQQNELDNIVQQAVYGYQINIMDIGKVYQVAEAAYVHGEDVTEAVHKLLDTIATKSTLPPSKSASLYAEAATNEQVIQMFAEDSFPKDKMPEWGTPNLKIQKQENGWALINYRTAIAYRTNEGQEFINTQKYSQTTTKIQNVLKQYMPGATEVDDAGIYKAMMDAPRTEEEQAEYGQKGKAEPGPKQEVTAPDSDKGLHGESSLRHEAHIDPKLGPWIGRYVEADGWYGWIVSEPDAEGNVAIDFEDGSGVAKRPITKVWETDRIPPVRDEKGWLSYPTERPGTQASLKKEGSFEVVFVEPEGKEQGLNKLTQFMNEKFKGMGEKVRQDQMEQQFETLCLEWAEANGYYMNVMSNGNVRFIKKELGEDPQMTPITSSIKIKADHLYGINSISAKKLDNGDLEITVSDPDELAEIKESVAAGDQSDQAMYDAFEHLIANGYMWVQPEDIGALTSAPILSDGSMKDDGSLDLSGGADVWWYPNYAVRSPMEDIAETGKTVFTFAPEDKEVESSQKRYAKYFEQFKQSDTAGGAWDLDAEARKLKKRKSLMKIQSTAEFFKNAGYKFGEGDKVWLVSGDMAEIVKQHAAAINEDKSYDAMQLDTYGNRIGSAFKISEKELQKA